MGPVSCLGEREKQWERSIKRKAGRKPSRVIVKAVEGDDAQGRRLNRVHVIACIFNGDT